MAFRFVHAADIHLDSPLRSLALRDPGLADLIGNATRQAFTGIVDLCLDEEVDALLLAGDLYDGDQTLDEDGAFFAEQLRRLDEAGIRVFIIRGNHDALSRITKELSSRTRSRCSAAAPRPSPSTERLASLASSIHGLSFAQPHAPDSLLARYKAPVEGAVNIGIMHTSLAGAPGHDPYAPCSVADLRRPASTIGRSAMSTSVRGGWRLRHRDARHASGPRHQRGRRQVRHAGHDCRRPLDPHRGASHQHRAVRAGHRRAGGIADWRDMVATIAKAMEEARASVAAGIWWPGCVSIGRTPLAWRIRRDLDLLKTEAEHRAAATGAAGSRSWRSTARLRMPCSASPADPIMELRRLIESQVVRSDAFRRLPSALARNCGASCRRNAGTSSERTRRVSRTSSGIGGGRRR